MAGPPRPAPWCVQGAAIERFAQMTNWDYYEAARRFQKVLEAAGINKALTKAGVEDGDTVVIGELSLEWSHDQVRAQVLGGRSVPSVS